MSKKETWLNKAIRSFLGLSNKKIKGSGCNSSKCVYVLPEDDAASAHTRTNSAHTRPNSSLKKNQYLICEKAIGSGTSGCVVCDNTSDIYKYIINEKISYNLLNNNQEIIEDKNQLITILNNDKYCIKVFKNLGDNEKKYASREYLNITQVQELFKDKEYGLNSILHPHDKNNILFYLSIINPNPPILSLKKNNKYKGIKNIPLIITEQCKKMSSITGIDNIIKYRTDILFYFKILHNANYIHGDFKLENTVLCEDRYKIIDWGNLKKMEDDMKIESIAAAPTYSSPYFAVLYIDQKKLYEESLCLKDPPDFEMFEILNRLYINFEETYYKESRGGLIKFYNDEFSWIIVYLSYSLLYYKFNNKKDIYLLLKKNDEYALALLLYNQLLLISNDKYKLKIVTILTKYYYQENFKENESISELKTILGDDIQSEKIITEIINIYKLLSPDYLNLELISENNNSGGRGLKNTKVKNDKKKKSSIK